MRTRALARLLSSSTRGAPASARWDGGRHRLGPWLLSAVAAAATTLSSYAALSAPGPCPARQLQAAGTLADKAYEQFEAADYAAAIETFRQAEETCHSPRLLVFIARAHVRLEQLLRARELLQQAANEPLSPRSPASFREAQAEARKDLDELTPRIPVLHVKLSGASASEATALLDGEAVAIERLQQGLEVDPGEHTLRVEAPGIEAVERRLKLVASRAERLEIVLQEPEPVAPPPTASTSGSLAPSIAAFGVGAVGFGVGIVTGILSTSTVSDIKSRCLGTECLKSDAEAADRAALLGNVSTVGFIVGGLGVATGAVFLLLRSGNDSSVDANGAASAPRLTVGIGPGSIRLDGRF
ncbi:hypothetical protein [Chondromyces crocatus]|uniref:PEGA domain-containing protein n=1 Tax=Chondromyces crocatus TaxID=52 RepID=A0A0K1EL39_CHOCO|nr:hypothetical protein [Chondromyces crocatus]AKT41551.1 uncharacterized protein CMC5_057580 [Chondromyces crocatus]